MSSRNISSITRTLNRTIRRNPRAGNTGGRAISSFEDFARLEWWSESRFGMFIHWGLYSIPAGWWKDREIPGLAEWLMFHTRMPLCNYKKLAQQFNPVGYDAEKWVTLAKQAGAKYIVITSKHHDGFAIFNSPCSNYNIVNATPFGRDPIKELADACRMSDMKLGFYYSQDQDWHHPGGSGNDWDYPNQSLKTFDNYLETKVKPQIRELLTRYGPVALIWFDTPYTISHKQSLDLSQLVHELQPDCLVSGRVGNNVGDYGSLGDNQIPAGRIEGFWETPATMNDSWGFRQGDDNWKSVDTLLALLVELASKGINYLLNIGPTAEGMIPQPCVDRMEEIGQWLAMNGEAIYGTTPSPFPMSFDWGSVTVKDNKLYLMITVWPEDPFVIHGLRNPVTRAYLLADPGVEIPVYQQRNAALDHDVIELNLQSKPPDKHVSVVILELEGKPQIDPIPLQQPNGKIVLLSTMAELHNRKKTRPIGISPSGITEGWTNKANWMSWRFKIVQPNEFNIVLVTGTQRYTPIWKGGHSIKVTIVNQSFRHIVKRHRWQITPRAQYFPEAATRIGKIAITHPGIYEIKLRVENIRKNVQ